MINSRLIAGTARKTNRGGFTLVELLVVIGIIAILAGVALGPITRGIKQAKQNAGLQTARTIALSEFTFSNDNGQAYPDTANPGGNTGTGAEAVARALLAGNYISDPGIFFTSGGTAKKYTGTTASTSITAENISYDFAGTATGGGVNSNAPDQMPVCWSSVTGGTIPDLATANVAVTCVPSQANPYGTDGVAVAYKSNSSAFKIGNATTHICTMTDASYPGMAGTKVLPGGG